MKMPTKKMLIKGDFFPHVSKYCYLTFIIEKKVTMYILIKIFKNEMQLKLWQFPKK